MAGISETDKEIQSLIDIISNTIEAHTTALFLASAEGEPLELAAYQSLSGKINTEAVIRPGEGLIGWVHKNNEPVNVDKFEHDTRRLFLYKTDEPIKSFMAVPLSKVGGVLAVDSKQRYVFTEKSHKILFQFGQALEMLLERKREAVQTARAAECLAFITNVESILARRLHTRQSAEEVLQLLGEFCGAEACFLTAVLPGKKGSYFLMAFDSPVDPGLESRPMKIESGLAGWVLQNGKQLVLERGRSGREKSYLFYPEENLGKFPSFAGYPLAWGDKVRGALLFIGEKPFKFESPVARAIEAASARLAASLEMELLFERVSELTRLDPQIGLPHRTYFCRRLNRMIKTASIQGSKIRLMLLKLNGLNDVALEFGQEASQEALKIAAAHLLSVSTNENELGHINYGLLAAALKGYSVKEEEDIKSGLVELMEDFPLQDMQGRLSIEVQSCTAEYPSEARTAEDLIKKGLDKLEQISPTPSGR